MEQPEPDPDDECDDLEQPALGRAADPAHSKRADRQRDELDEHGRPDEGRDAELHDREAQRNEPRKLRKPCQVRQRPHAGERDPAGREHEKRRRDGDREP